MVPGAPMNADEASISSKLEHASRPRNVDVSGAPKSGIKSSFVIIVFATQLNITVEQSIN